MGIRERSKFWAAQREVDGCARIVKGCGRESYRVRVGRERTVRRSKADSGEGGRADGEVDFQRLGKLASVWVRGGMGMLANYFKTAFRAIVRGRSYSLITIIGLSTGMAFTDRKSVV